jgi:hypothetical protein
MSSMSKERKLTKAGEKREAGNALFKEGKHAAAINAYQAAKSLLDSVWDARNDASVKESKANLSSNIAICQLKLGHFEQVWSHEC